MASRNLEPDELVVLYPSIGSCDSDGQWRITVAGTVYHPREIITLQKRILIRLLRRVMNVAAGELEGPLFQRRIERFITATQGGKRVAIAIGDRTYRLARKSKRNGHFRGTVRIPEPEMDRLIDGGHVQDGWLNFRVVSRGDDARHHAGRSRLISPTGISVISDIDDTIKHTQVTSRQMLLANTFLRDFEAVDGMPGVYQSWRSGGAEFHYVSSSPWQLYDALAELCEPGRFPVGTFHLRSFRLRDHMLRRLLLIRRAGKGATIKSILRRFPNRRFVLIGDSGERDPEIYGAIARKFPGQVAAIYIRELAGRPMEPVRRRKSFRNLDDVVCRIYRAADELPAVLTQGVQGMWDIASGV